MQTSFYRLGGLQWLFLIASITALSGCQSPTPEPAPADPAVVASLISRGDRAAEAGHWDEPMANSALDYYQRAQALQPDSLPLRRRIEGIVERYLTRARSAAEQHAHAQARSMLARARLADAEHPGIAPTTKYLQTLADAQRMELDISRTALRNRDPALIKQLQRYGGQARSPDCRTHIRAGSDADGRWIYQQMSKAPGSQRIRAQFEIGTPAKVALLCKPLS